MFPVFHFQVGVSKTDVETGYFLSGNYQAGFIVERVREIVNQLVSTLNTADRDECLCTFSLKCMGLLPSPAHVQTLLLAKILNLQPFPTLLFMTLILCMLGVGGRWRRFIFLGLHSNFQNIVLEWREGYRANNNNQRNYFPNWNQFLKGREIVCLFGGIEGLEIVWSRKISLLKWLLKWDI